MKHMKTAAGPPRNEVHERDALVLGRPHVLQLEQRVEVEADSAALQTDEGMVCSELPPTQVHRPMPDVGN